MAICVAFYLPKAMEVKDDLIYYQPIWHLLVLTEPDLKNRILQKCYTVDFLRGMSDKFQVRHLVARYIHYIPLDLQEAIKVETDILVKCQMVISVGMN